MQNETNNSQNAPVEIIPEREGPSGQVTIEQVPQSESVSSGTQLAIYGGLLIVVALLIFGLLKIRKNRRLFFIAIDTISMVGLLVTGLAVIGVALVNGYESLSDSGEIPETVRLLVFGIVLSVVGIIRPLHEKKIALRSMLAITAAALPIFVFDGGLGSAPVIIYIAALAFGVPLYLLRNSARKH